MDSHSMRFKLLNKHIYTLIQNIEAMSFARLGRLQDQGNRLLENTMIMITLILNLIDYDYIVK